MTESVPPTPAKADPEALALRTPPPRVIRFRRGLLVGAAATGTVTVIAIAWFALRPITLHRATDQSQLSEPVTQSSEALERLPASYAQVPRLGPPLPGDLGRPILGHQRSIGAAPQDAGATAGQQALLAERQRLADARRAAQESPLLVQQRSAPEQGPIRLAAPSVPEASDPAAAAGALGDANGQQRKLAFVSSVDSRGDTNPHRLAPAPSPYLLSAGSVIAASLITGLRSDLPGLVTAQVTDPVYDSPTGRILLIPQGARLLGSYDSVVAFGQRRALIVWQRILLPDGSSLRLDNAPATDPSGYAGLADKVDFHSWTLLKGIVLSTLLGVGSELALSGDGDLVEAVRRSTQDNASRAGDQLTMRNLNIQPTITIRPGALVRLVVHKDLILAPWSKGGA